MPEVICKQCGERFPADQHHESTAFDRHDCPNIVQPRKGESFEDYSARCETERDQDDFALVDKAIKALQAKLDRLTTDKQRLETLSEFMGYGETALEIYAGDPEGTPEVMLACAMGNLEDNTWDMRQAFTIAEIVQHVEAIQRGDS